MKYHRADCHGEPSRDYAPFEPRRSELFDLLGNAIGAFCILGGIAIFIAAAHFLPDSAVIELPRNVP